MDASIVVISIVSQKSALQLSGCFLRKKVMNLENLTFKVYWNTPLSHVIASYIETFHGFYDTQVSEPHPGSQLRSQLRLQFFNEGITLYSSYRKWE